MLSLSEKASLKRSLEDKEFERALTLFFREEGLFATSKLVRSMKSVPPQTEEAIQSAAIAGEYENLMSKLKTWAKRQQ
jgi:hypothetical protein